MYVFELSFRIIDYFFDKFLWAITDTDPYARFNQALDNERVSRDMEDMNESDIENLDMKQLPNTMEMDVRIHRPTIIFKVRSYLNSNIELDLGEIKMTYEERSEMGRFHKAPNKPALITTYFMEFKDLGIKYSEDQFEVAS